MPPARVVRVGWPKRAALLWREPSSGPSSGGSRAPRAFGLSRKPRVRPRLKLRSGSALYRVVPVVVADSPGLDRLGEAVSAVKSRGSWPGKPSRHRRNLFVEFRARPRSGKTSTGPSALS